MTYIVSNLQDLCKNFPDTAVSEQRLYWNSLEKSVWWNSTDGDDGYAISEIVKQLEDVDEVEDIRIESKALPPRDVPGWELIWSKGLTGVITVFRGMSWDEYNRFKNGGTLEPRDFNQVSLDKDTARSYAQYQNDEGVLVQFQVPRDALQEDDLWNEDFRIRKSTRATNIVPLQWYEDLKPVNGPEHKSLTNYEIKGKGETCKKGERSDETGCVPVNDDSFSQSSLNWEEFDKLKVKQEREFATVNEDHPEGLEPGDEGFFEWLESKSGRRAIGAINRHVELSGVLNTSLRKKENLSEILQKDVEDLDFVFSHPASKLDRDLILYRALTPEQWEESQREDNFVDGGYPSVAWKKETAGTFGNHVITIKAPKGSRAIYGSKNENEIILPRNSKFEKQSDGTWLLNNKEQKSYTKSLMNYYTKDKGQPCTRGERSDETGCIPVTGDMKPLREGFQRIEKKPLAKPEAKGPKHEWIATEGNISPELKERLKGLKLPPAWTNVQIAQDPKSPLQATGFDSKGREQYVYSAEHSEKAAAEKFLRVKALVSKLPEIDKNIETAMNGPDGPDKESASVLFLMRLTGFRIGGEDHSLTEHEALGASTLTGKNVKISGDRCAFSFIGKKGVHIKQVIKNPELAKMLTPRIKGKNRLFDTGASKVRQYLGGIAGESFHPKDLRTIVAADTALKSVSGMKNPPKNEAQLKKYKLAVGKDVSQKLGNTPVIALKSYIPPEVFTAWEKGIEKTKQPTGKSYSFDFYRVKSLRFKYRKGIS